MKNGVMLLAVVLALLGFAGMMRVKTDVQTLMRTRQQLADQRLELKEHKRVLEAEYALLASPGRLKTLALSEGYIPASPLMIMPLAGPSLAKTPQAVTLTSVSATVGAEVSAPADGGASPSGVGPDPFAGVRL